MCQNPSNPLQRSQSFGNPSAMPWGSSYNLNRPMPQGGAPIPGAQMDSGMQKSDSFAPTSMPINVASPDPSATAQTQAPAPYSDIGQPNRYIDTGMGSAVNRATGIPFDPMGAPGPQSIPGGPSQYLQGGPVLRDRATGRPINTMGPPVGSTGIQNPGAYTGAPVAGSSPSGGQPMTDLFATNSGGSSMPAPAGSTGIQNPGAYTGAPTAGYSAGSDPMSMVRSMQGLPQMQTQPPPQSMSMPGPMAINRFDPRNGPATASQPGSFANSVPTPWGPKSQSDLLGKATTAPGFRFPTPSVPSWLYGPMAGLFGFTPPQGTPQNYGVSPGTGQWGVQPGAK